MASNRRRFVVKHPVIVHIGCFRKLKLPSFLSKLLRKLLSKILRISPDFSSSATTTTTTTTNNTFSLSFNDTTSPSFIYPVPDSPITKPKERKKKTKKGKQKVGGVPVQKMSADPYIDFRDSMLEMIIQMEIDTWDGFLVLAGQFLALNAPCKHPYILRAFTEIWTEVYSHSASTPGRY